MNQLGSITTDEPAGDRESVMRRGNVYQIANGYMGYRGTLDEFGSGECVGVTLAGLFDRVGSAWREPVNAPNAGFTRVSLDGRELSVLTGGVTRHRQTLHFANAGFERETVFRHRGKSLTVRSERFLSAAMPNLGVVRFSVTCDRAAELVLRTGIDANIWDLNGPHLPRLTLETPDGILLVHGRTGELGKEVVVAEAADTDFGATTYEVHDQRNLRVIQLQAKPGEVYTLTKFFAVFTGNDRPGQSLRAAAIATVKQARALGFAACLARHDTEWAAKWDRCDVTIDGDEEAQHALRYSILQLLMAAPVNGTANSIPARALSGQVYKGAIFWDTEMFMLPFFLHTYPEKAVELLRYRIRTLDGARRKARTEGPGYRGAFYAWESQDTGDDACTYCNIGDPFTGRDLRTHFRDKQVHISGDVAMAFWEHFRVTGDDSLLLEGGAEVILECARFYLSYVYFKPDKRRYEVLDVIGPDEYHERVNNNAFTNQVVKETFAIANAAVAHLRRAHPEALRALVRRLGIARELPKFAEAGRRLYVPRPAPKTGLIEQFDGYFQLKDTTVEQVKARMVHPNEYLGAGQGLAVQTKVIKQADVVMMLNLFRSRYPADIKRANWEYYEPLTEHGSSLSACAYAMVATEFGNLDFAYRYFLKTAKIDLEARYKMYVGTIFTGGSHPAANGGAWMTAIFGFGGIRADDRRLTIAPRLYPKWRSLALSLAHRGGRFRVTITRQAVTIVADPANRRAQSIAIGDRTVSCRPGKSVTVNYRSAAAGRSGVASRGRRSVYSATP
ncbi:MAG TPA: glycosyl hydrolase family 65 protein [Opitutaceae bacterium]|nr:glycosyl hydrolase family 65 protein [Opitutaceae bacterium]